MTDQASSVINAALGLSDVERAEVAAALLESLPADDNWYTQEDLAEWNRRMQALSDGTDPGVPWEEVKAKMRRLINESSGSL